MWVEVHKPALSIDQQEEIFHRGKGQAAYPIQNQDPKAPLNIRAESAPSDAYSHISDGISRTQFNKSGAGRTHPSERPYQSGSNRFDPFN
jgi:hypothetical protein